MSDPNLHTSLVQVDGHPHRRFYTGHDLSRVLNIGDLQAITHKRMPRFVVEYLEAGSEDEAALARDRQAFADWRFIPHQLVDVSKRSLAGTILGKPVPFPVMIAPTGLNGLFRYNADVELAQGAAKAGIPFIQSTMSNDTMEDVAKAGGRHWWQLYVFGGEEVWQAIIERADKAGCEALVITTNAQIYGNREWDSRTRATKSRPSIPTTLDAALHPGWLGSTLALHGMPSFKNAVDYVPKDKRGFFESAFWIREHQPRSLDWKTIARIREIWKKPLIIKGLLHPDDFRRALDAGIQAVVLETHGGRQLDWSVAGLDMLPTARKIIGDRMEIYMAGGIRRGTDILKAVGLGADAVMTGRATLYGLCAAGVPGVTRALEILQTEASDAMGLLGVNSLKALGPDILVQAKNLPLVAEG